MTLCSRPFVVLYRQSQFHFSKIALPLTFKTGILKSSLYLGKIASQQPNSILHKHGYQMYTLQTQYL
jgi:hypothetical protein